MGLIHDPDILLIDEPFVGLDYGVKSKIITFLKSVNKTILCVSHDLELAENNATKVLLLDQGKALEFSNPSDIISGNPYVLEELDLKTGSAIDPSFSNEFSVVNHNNRLIISCPNTNENKKTLSDFKTQYQAAIFSSKSAENNLLSTLVGHYNYTLSSGEKGAKKGKKNKKK